MTAPTMRLPPLNALRVFLAAAQARSFTQAAQEIHLTQGAVSRQIQTLEAFYRTPLFVREQRGLTLTAAGEALLPAVQQAFGLIREASEALARRESDIRVRVAPTPAMRWLLPNLPDFQTRHPEYTLHLITQLMHDTPFNAAEYDLAIVGLTEPLMPGLISECLSREQLVPVCAPGLLERGPPLVTPDDLRNYVLLHPWREQDSWGAWLRLAGARRVDGKSGITFDTLEFALHAAARSMGVTLAQLSMIHEDVASGRLVIPFDTVLETEWGYYLVYPAHLVESPKVKAFRNWLVALLPGMR
ncbi:DNA-binding transcriptional regulator, LysR family [Gulbenkiania indica]|uniref:DNA-binding transcriptional regulator, LysR family n=1 Tax=Gulbenkiania indica TaxID=375574 RepID=A0A0K6GXZ2_9NEIS|nr:LysR substrate-binding domain-containing protein [Gulbenkiania indica]CUA83455.1 DNA-binding transcriptional regulator, LysR family [Gulbenkiania indica]